MSKRNRLLKKLQDLYEERNYIEERINEIKGRVGTIYIGKYITLNNHIDDNLKVYMLVKEQCFVDGYTKLTGPCYKIIQNIKSPFLCFISDTLCVADETNIVEVSKEIVISNLTGFTNWLQENIELIRLE